MEIRNDMEWISVKERLPEKSGEVFAVGGKLYRPKVICFNNVHSSSWTSSIPPIGFWDNGYYVNDDITHWMPVPERPKSMLGLRRRYPKG